MLGSVYLRPVVLSTSSFSLLVLLSSTSFVANLPHRSFLILLIISHLALPLQVQSLSTLQMTSEYLIQPGCDWSDQSNSEYSLFSNFGDLLWEEAMKDILTPDLANHLGSYDCVATDKPTTSPTDVEGICDSQVPVQDAAKSPRHATDYPTPEGSVTRPCGSPGESPDESSVISEPRSDSSVKKPSCKLDGM